MHGELGRAGWTGAWVALTLCGLSACSGAPEGRTAAASSGAPSSSVVEAVRVATDRSAILQGAVTLPGGERARRLTLGSGFNHVLVGRMGPDGKPVVSCVDSATAAEAFLAGGGTGGGQ